MEYFSKQDYSLWILTAHFRFGDIWFYQILDFCFEMEKKVTSTQFECSIQNGAQSLYVSVSINLLSIKIPAVDVRKAVYNFTELTQMVSLTSTTAKMDCNTVRK